MPRIRRAARSTLVLATGLLALAGLAACGSTGSNASDPSAVLVSFRGKHITRATLAHWIPIEAILQRDLAPQTPPPAGLVPDPPNYTACIAYEISISPIGEPKPTSAQAKKTCETRDQQIRTHMLELLISYMWTEAQAHELGLTITPQEFQSTWARNKLELFGSQTNFERSLKATGETEEDEFKILRFDMQSEKIKTKILKEHGIPGLRAYYHQYPQEYAKQTSCTPEYTLPDCKQYKGTQQPEG
jgi:hypothetical protein